MEKIIPQNFRTYWTLVYSTKHPWVKGIQVCSNVEPFKNSHKVNNVFFFLLLINVMI